MAGERTQSDRFDPYLSPNQQDLLLAALTSNNVNVQPHPPASQILKRSSSDSKEYQHNTDDSNMPLFVSPQQQTSSSSEFGAFGLDDSPFLDYLDADGNFDFDSNEHGQMIGNLPNDPNQNDYDGEVHDKRKSPEDDEDDEDGGGKRREGDDKTAKKPGRKPLTTEPTTKRKAQNRAAQRAFRERKERHLKDLETKVSELQKTSEADKHEKGLLKAQVERLQTELREYRKRLSMNSTGISRSPPAVGGGFFAHMAKNTLHNNNNNSANNFQFDFPRFGGLPGSKIFNNGPVAIRNEANAVVTIGRPTASASPVTGTLLRQDSGARSLSPKSQTNGSVSSPKRDASIPGSMNKYINGSTDARTNSYQVNPVPGQVGGFDELAGLFSPSILNSVSNDTSFDYGFPPPAETVKQPSRSSVDSSNGLPRAFQFNSHGSTASNTASPSASSVSQYNANSSCGTSPEPSHNSPARERSTDNAMVGTNLGYSCQGDSEGEIAFCQDLNMACGNPRNPVPRTMAQTQPDRPPPVSASASKTPVLDVNSFDWMASQNGGQFKPDLFGDYRESQDAIVGAGDFTGGFFNEAFPFADFGSPINLVDSPAAVAPKSSSSSLLEQVERQQNGDDHEEVVPAVDRSQMLTCNKIWNQLQKEPDFGNPGFDLDGLCKDLKAKAKCSESGVVIKQEDFDDLLKKKKQQQTQPQLRT
ncbi:AP1-like transcription factor-like protein [Cryomyces antarcticus]